MSAMPSKIRFLWEFIHAPASVGAVAPSSDRLTERMMEWIDWPSVTAVAEFGPGTGVFTRSILERKRSDCDFFAVEKNVALAEVFRRQFPGVRLYEECASSVPELCRREGIERLDCIVCGLPWAAFTEELQDDILAGIRRALRPGGQLVTFAYLQGLLLPAGRRFRGKLQSSFSEVGQSPVVWKNLPPAFVYRCRL